MLQFYNSLYAPDPTDKEVAQRFLDKIRLPTISLDQLETLNAPISMTELTTTIQHLAPNKAFGPDGFTGKCYKTLQEIIKPTLLSGYNSFWLGGSYLPMGN